jgi:hypothetical protein
VNFSITCIHAQIGFSSNALLHDFKGMQLGSTIENIVHNELGGGNSRSAVNLDI